MKQQTKNSLSVLGICIALSALWFTWLTFQEVPVQSKALEIQQAIMGGSGPTTYSGTMGGFDGSLLYTPLWTVVMLVSFAHVAQLMDASDFFYIPTSLKWIAVFVAIFFPAFAIIYPLFYPGITPSLGPYVALISAAIATATMTSPTTTLAQTPMHAG